VAQPSPTTFQHCSSQAQSSSRVGGPERPRQRDDERHTRIDVPLIVPAAVARSTSPGPIRRCRRYLRLIDPTSRVWFHAFGGTA
jgi:hypothetical protein